MDLSTPGRAGFADKLRVALDQNSVGGSTLLGQLLEAYRPYLLQIANDELDTDLQGKAGGSDLVQQTFLEAQKDLVNFRGKSEAELMAWLRRVLLNNLANFRRQFRTNGKRDVSREVPMQGGDSSVPSVGELATSDLSPSGAARAHEEAAAVEAALARLPEDYRQAIVLRHQQGLSFAEIGAALGRSPEAVRKLWARAIEALQEQLGPPS